MAKTARRNRTTPDPTLEEQRPVGEEETTPEGGEGAESAEGGETNGHGTETEEPAQMEVKMKGTASGVRSAARRLAGETARPASRPEKEPPEDDGTDALLADPKNMVVVTRQLPRVFVLRNGEEVRCAVKVEKYTCPITRDEIEEDVFGRFGGKKYKATIHPNTTTGENTILGAFTMEHPNPETPPYVEDPETPEEAAARLSASIPGGTDPTMRETDNLADMKAALQRRLERANMMKEIKETERMVKEAERELQNDGKPAAPAAPVGPDPRDREIEELRKKLEKKETDDRFAAMQQSIQQTSTQIAELSKSIATLAPRLAQEGDPKNSLAIQMLTQSQQHSKDMLEIAKTINRPVAAPVTTEDQLDKMLDRFNKMKNAFGKDDSRVSEFQDKLLEMAMDRALGGGGDEGGEEEDTMKFAIKQFTPVLKTYVEKQVEKEEGGKGGGEKVSKERLKEIYAEAASKAAKELEVKWQKEGWIVRDPNAGRNLPAPQKKPGLPAPKNPPPGKVVARTKTAEGIVEHVKVEPADLSQKTTPKGNAATSESSAPVEKKKEAEEVRYTEMPGVGKVEIPPTPGDMKYNRQASVNFVLDAILSEIHEGVPTKAAGDPATESFVPADALEFLDDELLAEIHRATSGDELDETLGKWGDKAKIDKIKDAGAKDKAIDSWLRRVIRTIQDVWRDQQKEKGNG